MLFNFDNSYEKQLEGFYSKVKPAKAPFATLIKFNEPLASSLDLNYQDLQNHELALIFSGNKLCEGSSSIAQVYAGHQFGGFSPQLGDGRALLLGELVAPSGARVDLQLKGSGITPFSRQGDGKSALGPVLREYLIAEAMYKLNIPTTRALAAVITGEKVMRERMLPGAVLTRVAASHIRVGTFQYFASQNEFDKVKQLADYTIQRHFPDLTNSKNPYLDLLKAVCDRQAEVIAKWMLVGFVHGVMNTDNVTISGETIDYGPCAFIDQYAASSVFSSIDRQGRYAYDNQPIIGQWNMARFAETLLPLIHDDSQEAIRLATNSVNLFNEKYNDLWLQGMRAKLGFFNQEDNDRDITNKLLELMEEKSVDFTRLFRGLSSCLQGDSTSIRKLFTDDSTNTNAEKFEQWFKVWTERLARDPSDTKRRISLMNSVNPIYIPRNHKVEEALQAAENDFDFVPFKKLMKLLEEPYLKQDGFEEYEVPAPSEFGSYQTFCGT